MLKLDVDHGRQILELFSIIKQKKALHLVMQECAKTKLEMTGYQVVSTHK